MQEGASTFAQRIDIGIVIPVLADIADFESWRRIAEKVTVIVDCSSSPDPNYFKTLIKNIESVSRKRNRQVTFIYTSGTWVYGDTNGTTVNETDFTPLEPSNVLKLVAWRPEIEELVANSKVFKGIVLRPGMCLQHAQG